MTTFSAPRSLMAMGLILLFSCSLKVLAKEDKQLAQQIYAKLQPAVFKIKTSTSSEAPQAAYGTAFVIDKNGLLLTNYHVISSSFLKPKKRKIFLVDGDETFEGKILAVDILQDLALVRVDRTFNAVLSFASNPTKQGDTIFSVGQPEDLNMAIITGTYNNEIRYGQYGLIHMSSPLNSGMSGGPTVNQRGEIVGVNVAKSVGSDSLSFSVPARFALSLVARGKARVAFDEDQIWQEIRSQIESLQNDFTADFLSHTKKNAKLGHWQVPGVSPLLRCWSQGTEDDKSPYEVQVNTCYLAHGAFLDDSTRTGNYSLTLQRVQNRSLNHRQFFSVLNNSFRDLSFGDRTRQDENSILTKAACEELMFTSQNRIPFKIAICGRGYPRLSALKDYKISFVSLSGPPSALLGEIDLRGFSLENAKKILEATLTSISRLK